MLIPLTRNNAFIGGKTIEWFDNDVVITHNLNKEVVCCGYNNDGDYFYLDAKKIDDNKIRLNFTNQIPTDITYQIVLKEAESFELTDANEIGLFTRGWIDDVVVIEHELGKGLMVQVWNEQQELVQLPIVQQDNNVIKIDFADTNKPTQGEPWLVTYVNGTSFEISKTDGSSEGFSWIWDSYEVTVSHNLGFCPFINLYNGDELVGWDIKAISNDTIKINFENDFYFQLFESILIVISEGDSEITSYEQFYASGFPQLNLMTEEVIEVLIPALGDHRQYFMIDAQTDTFGSGLYYHFQVSRNYNFVNLIYDVIQDSNDSFPYLENTINQGNVFFVPKGENLISGHQYYWRVRFSDKRMIDGNLVWGNWSKKFSFFVNSLPKKIENLTINSR